MTENQAEGIIIKNHLASTHSQKNKKLLGKEDRAYVVNTRMKNRSIQDIVRLLYHIIWC